MDQLTKQILKVVLAWIAMLVFGVLAAVQVKLFCFGWHLIFQ